MFQDYYEAAGVSEAWLNHLRIMVQLSDYWQTGENLWKDKSGIITNPLGNHVPRGGETYRFYSSPNRADLQQGDNADEDNSTEVLQRYVDKPAKKQSAGFLENQ